MRFSTAKGHSNLYIKFGSLFVCLFCFMNISLTVAPTKMFGTIGKPYESRVALAWCYGRWIHHEIDIRIYYALIFHRK